MVIPAGDGIASGERLFSLVDGKAAGVNSVRHLMPGAKPVV
jgi:hypothetical protein